MKTSEIIVFIVYLLCMLGIGIFFFVKNRRDKRKDRDRKGCLDQDEDEPCCFST